MSPARSPPSVERRRHSRFSRRAELFTLAQRLDAIVRSLQHFTVRLPRNDHTSSGVSGDVWRRTLAFQYQIIGATMRNGIKNARNAGLVRTFRTVTVKAASAAPKPASIRLR